MLLLFCQVLMLHTKLTIILEMSSMKSISQEHLEVRIIIKTQIVILKAKL